MKYLYSIYLRMDQSQAPRPPVLPHWLRSLTSQARVGHRRSEQRQQEELPLH